MTEKPALPDLTTKIHHLLEAVKGVCDVDGRGRWLAAPMALLMWIGTWRMRREAALAMEQFRAGLEQILVLLEDFRAGRLVAATPEVRAPEVHAAPEEMPGGSPALPRRRSQATVAPRPARSMRSAECGSDEIGPGRCALMPGAGLTPHPTPPPQGGWESAWRGRESSWRMRLLQARAPPDDDVFSKSRDGVSRSRATILLRDRNEAAVDGTAERGQAGIRGTRGNRDVE